jgi:hypothetical protein
MQNQIVVYEDGEIELKVQLTQENIWITQKQLAILFNVEVHTINYHIKIYLNKKN